MNCEPGVLQSMGWEAEEFFPFDAHAAKGALEVFCLDPLVVVTPHPSMAMGRSELAPSVVDPARINESSWDSVPSDDAAAAVTISNTGAYDMGVMIFAFAHFTASLKEKGRAFTGFGVTAGVQIAYQTYATGGSPTPVGHFGGYTDERGQITPSIEVQIPIDCPSLVGGLGTLKTSNLGSYIIPISVAGPQVPPGFDVYVEPHMMARWIYASASGSGASVSTNVFWSDAGDTNSAFHPILELLVIGTSIL